MHRMIGKKIQAGWQENTLTKKILLGNIIVGINVRKSMGVQ